MALPPVQHLSIASIVGISGGRSPAPCSLRALSAVLARLSVSSCICVGCARGIDETVRKRMSAGRLHVFQAASYGAGQGSFAARSIACVRAVAGAASACLWVAFPATACPAGLRPSPSPSACFSGFGSGTWAALAFAIGSGVPCLVFLPPGVSPPFSWPLTPVAGTHAWWQFTPATIQGTLFG